MLLSAALASAWYLTVVPMVGAAATPSGEAHIAQTSEAQRKIEATLPKMKTNRAAAKRFKITGSGRVRRGKGGHSHGMISKNRKHNRRLRKADMVHPHQQKRIKLLLPYA